MDISLETWNIQDIIHILKWPLALERLSAAVWGNTRTGKWEGMDGGIGGGKRAYGTFGEWGGRKGEII